MYCLQLSELCLPEKICYQQEGFKVHLTNRIVFGSRKTIGIQDEKDCATIHCITRILAVKIWENCQTCLASQLLREDAVEFR